jgi:hypothetical protein
MTTFSSLMSNTGFVNPKLTTSDLASNFSELSQASALAGQRSPNAGAERVSLVAVPTAVSFLRTNVLSGTPFLPPTLYNRSLVGSFARQHRL